MDKAMNETDEGIVLLVQKGDEESFGVLIRRYEGKITRYARKFLSGDDDIQDIVQGVFVKAYVNIQSFRSGGKFSSWLYRIAHNEFVNALRKRSRRGIISLDFLQTDIFFPHPVAVETSDADTDRRLNKEFLDKLLDQLHPKYREVMILFYFEDLDYGEIADVLRIPSSTVGVRLGRGRNILRTLYEKQYGRN